MQLHLWVYLLRCSDGFFYAGHTDNLEKRLYEHQAGTFRGYTSKRRPVELVWADYSDRREDALAFERRIKGWTRAKKEALIAGDWATIKWLSKPPSERASTSLSTNEMDEDSVGPERSASARSRRALSTNKMVGCGTKLIRPERSSKSEVEGRQRN